VSRRRRISRTSLADLTQRGGIPFEMYVERRGYRRRAIS
jgi:hypothetical protein